MTHIIHRFVNLKIAIEVARETKIFTTVKATTIGVVAFCRSLGCFSSQLGMNHRVATSVSKHTKEATAKIANAEYFSSM